MKKLLLAAALTVSLAVPSFAQGNRQCGTHSKVVEVLAEKYGETLQSRALFSGVPATMMEVYANLESGTFTILQTNANGFSCMVGTGKEYANILTPAPAGGEDS